MAARVVENKTGRPGDLFFLGLSLVAMFERKGNKARVVTETGGMKGVRVSELEGPLSYGVPSNTVEGIRQALRKAAGDLRSRINDVNVADLWELVLDEEKEFSITDLTRLWFGDDASDTDRLVMARALLADPAYFGGKHLCFRPKPRKKVEACLRNIQARKQKQAEFERASAWFAELLKDKVSPPPPGHLDRFVAALREAAVEGSCAINDETAMLLKTLDLDPDEGAFELLVRLGIFSRHENILIHKFNIPVAFPSRVLEEADDIAAGRLVPLDGGREEFPHECFTIDDEGTNERDDALSLSTSPEGRRIVGIHITDAASLIRPDSLIDREARKRAATLYLPETSVTMLPPSLACDVLSLDPGTRRRAISILVEFDDEHQVLSTRIARTWINLSRALTYDEALAAAEAGDPVLSYLRQLAVALAARRQKAGANSFSDRKELRIRVNGEDINVSLLPRDCPARTTVAEMMILANCVAARTLRDKGIPCIFRTQELPAVDENSRFQAAAGPPLKVQVGTKAQSHATLGVDCYTQSTSPLRRYGDLLVQRQLSAVLEGNEPPYTEEQLAFLVDTTSLAQSTIKTIEKWSLRYWLLTYLGRLEDVTHQATVLFRRNESYVVELDAFAFRATLFPSQSRKYHEGQSLLVKVVKTKPKQGTLRIEEAYA